MYEITYNTGNTIISKRLNESELVKKKAEITVLGYRIISIVDLTIKLWGEE